MRAHMGHPEPFHLTMIGVGNEQWGDRYVERYKVFAAALKAQHPEIKLVVAAGPFPSGEPFDSMWATWRQLHADIVDEHYYMSPQWFLDQYGALRPLRSLRPQGLRRRICRAERRIHQR